MRKGILYGFRIVSAVLLSMVAMSSQEAFAADSASAIALEAMEAYQNLIGSNPSAAVLAQKAEAVLVFPAIVKGGFMVGGQYGKGALIKKGNVAEYYRSMAVSYGWQAGIQKFGYALIFMTKEDLDYLYASSGWEVGVGPSIVIMDTGMASSKTTTTLQKGVYAFFFSQKGLMAGVGLQGTKITRIYPLD